MAKTPTKKSNDTKVTRITASESAPAKTPAKKPSLASRARVAAGKSKKEEQQPTEKRSRKNPFVAFGRYIKGAWHELRQVRWPDRKSTWGMTGALIAFTAFFVLVILLLDYLFSELFKLILGSN